MGFRGINEVNSPLDAPDMLAEISESCGQLIDAISDELTRQIVLLKFDGWKNAEVANEVNRSERTVQRKLEHARRVWVEAGLHDDGEK